MVLPDGIAAATLHIRDGRVATILPADSRSRSGAAPGTAGAGAPVREPGAAAVELWDVGDLVVLPGLVDTHVHINEPGRTDWEGFATASRAAASGGVTTVVDMPLNSDPVTITAAAFDLKAEAAKGACTLDYGFWGGLVPLSVGRLEELAAAGVLGFKAFMVDSGIAEFPPVGRPQLEAAMPRIAALGLPLLVHAEAPGPIAAATEAESARLAREPERRRAHRAWSRTRPPEAEAEAIDLLAELALASGCRTHIVHVASAEAVRRVEAAKERGAPITAETCPHYLTFDGDAVPDGAVEYKCAPPIRGARHREALWRGLEAGVIDLVATDHSPCPPRLKIGASDGFLGAWGGIASLGLALPALWASSGGRNLSLDDVARWLGAAPARLAGIEDRKGAIREGGDADLAVFDPDPEYELTVEDIHFRHPMTPYLGRSMKGRVIHTLCRGRLVYSAVGAPIPHVGERCRDGGGFRPGRRVQPCRSPLGGRGLR